MPRIRIAGAALHAACGVCWLAAGAAGALAQATIPAVFVANNGNLEGSVTSYGVNPNGTVFFISKLITGSRPNTQVLEPGSNAQSIAITPNGRYLAVGHGTENNVTERITMLEVHADATVSVAGLFTTPDSPLGLVWIADDLLAVTATGGSPNGINVYRWNPAVPSLSFVDFRPTGSFSASVIVSPDRRFVYAPDSGTNNIFVLRVNPSGTMTQIQSQSTSPIFPLGPNFSPDGTKLYAGGGISNGGNKVIGFNANVPTGMLSPQAATPYVSPGVSPKLVVVSGDNKVAVVAHGTDATARTFLIDQSSGALTSTGFFYDIGFQGSLTDMAVMGNLLFITDGDTIDDGVRGLRSFTLGMDGSMTQNGTITDSQGISPWRIAVWRPATPCPADLDGDGSVGAPDLAILLGSWGGGGPADFDGGGVGASDLAILLGSWGPCP